MTRNIYDQPDFFSGYSQLGRSIGGLESAPEWPCLRAMLPQMTGLNVLDLGCGFGWFCRWARQAGAAQVLGLDVSERMLERARSTTQDAAITYQRADGESLMLPEAAFDLIYSSLVLHYIVEIERLLVMLHRALRPGGRFIFSMEHPIYTAPSSPRWMIDAAGHRTWPLDNYSLEGPRVTDWLVKGVVKQHRTIGTMLTLLLRHGFTLTHVEEWCPTDQQIEDRPELTAERERPMFLLAGAQR